MKITIEIIKRKEINLIKVHQINQGVSNRSLTTLLCVFCENSIGLKPWATVEIEEFQIKRFGRMCNECLDKYTKRTNENNLFIWVLN